MLECHWNNSQKVHCSSLVAYCKYCKSHLFFNFPLQNGWFLGSFVSFGCEIESDEEWLNGIAVLTCLSPSHTSVTAAICVDRNTSDVDNPTFLPNVSFIGLFTRRNPWWGLQLWYALHVSCFRICPDCL